MFEHKNLPSSLVPIVKKWSDSNLEFYLGPENIFSYKGKKIKYLANPDIPGEPGSWYAASHPYDFKEIPQLTKKQIEDIAVHLAGYFKPNRWSLTVDYRCNYKCTMCPYHGNGYEDGLANDYWATRKSYKQHISKEEAFDVIDKISSHNIKQLYIGSYGEIFMYPHWYEVSKYAGDKGLKLGTITNGSLVNDEICLKLKETGYVDIRVSLDALQYNTYYKIRRAAPEMFQKAMKAPGLLKKYGFNVNVHFVEQDDNSDEVADFLGYWKSSDVDSISITKQIVFHNGSSTHKRVAERDDYFNGICSKFGNFTTLTNGTIVVCCEMTGLLTDENLDKFPLVDLKRNSFDENVERLKGLIINEDSPLIKYCKKCPLYTLHTSEEIIDGWKIYKTHERETWVRLKQ